MSEVTETRGKKVIGVTGSICAGKQTVHETLSKKINATVYGLSDELRRLLEERGEQVTRPALRALAHELRKVEGGDALVKRLADRIRNAPTDFVIVESIRNPEEARTLKKEFGAFLVAVDAPLEHRFERAKARARENETMDFQEFKEVDAREISGRGEPLEGHDLGECMRLADYTLENNGSLQELEAKVDALVNEFEDFFGD